MTSSNGQAVPRCSSLSLTCSMWAAIIAVLLFLRVLELHAMQIGVLINIGPRPSFTKQLPVLVQTNPAAPIWWSSSIDSERLGHHLVSGCLSVASIPWIVGSHPGGPHQQDSGGLRITLMSGNLDKEPWHQMVNLPSFSQGITTGTTYWLSCTTSSHNQCRP
jgi:hypothetical protein